MIAQCTFDNKEEAGWTVRNLLFFCTVAFSAFFCWWATKLSWKWFFFLVNIKLNLSRMAIWGGGCAWQHNSASEQRPVSLWCEWAITRSSVLSSVKGKRLSLLWSLDGCNHNVKGRNECGNLQEGQTSSCSHVLSFLSITYFGWFFKRKASFDRNDNKWFSMTNVLPP